jgi:Tfp pilus assembly protein PilO
MNKMSKQKRTQFILALAGVLVVIGGIWYTLISYQQEGLTKLQARRKVAREKADQTQQTIRNSAQIESQLLGVSNQLAEKEADMASGDLYASMMNMVRKFKVPYRIDIPQLTSAGMAVEVNLLPRFPYKQVSISISGTAYYYDLGAFVADFENRFPYSRIINLDIVPASASRPEDREKLAFKMEIVSLVPPGAAHSANSQ